MKLKALQNAALILMAGTFLAHVGAAGCSKSAASLAAGLLKADPNAVVADYGDAPDGLPSKYPSGITAHFPTLYVNHGAHHLDITDSAFGPLKTDGNLSVSAEKDAVDPKDPDGIQNIDQAANDSDHDAFDNGLLSPVLKAGASNEIDFLVSVAAAAPKQTRYVNMLADWDQNGVWADQGGTEEWIVQNMPIDVDPGTTVPLTTPEFLAGGVTDNVWLRMTLSDTPIDATAFPSGWDGTGEFAKGETEDYLLQDHVALDLKHVIGGKGPGGGGTGTGTGTGGGTGGGGTGGGGTGGGNQCEFWRSQQATICKGSARTFLATIGGFAPDSVTATSSDPSVAGVTVNEANVTVTGEDEGSATIDVTVEADGCLYHVTILVTVKTCGGAAAAKPRIECCSEAEYAKDPAQCDNCSLVGAAFYDNETPAGGGDSANGGIEQTDSWGNTDANNPTKSYVVGVGNTVKIVVNYYQCDPCEDEIDDTDGDGIPNELDWFPNESYDVNNPHDTDEEIYVDHYFDQFFDENNDHEIVDLTVHTPTPVQDPTPPSAPTTPYTFGTGTRF